MDTSNLNTESYLDKDLDVAWDSFENQIFYRYRVFDSRLHGCSQELVILLRNNFNCALQKQKRINVAYTASDWSLRLCPMAKEVAGRSHWCCLWKTRNVILMFAKIVVSANCYYCTRHTTFWKGDKYEYMNVIFLNKQQKRVIIGSPDLSSLEKCLRIVLQSMNTSGSALMNWSHTKEVDKCGKIYDWENSSFLLDFDDLFVLCLSRLSLSFYFLLQLQDNVGNIRKLLEIFTFLTFTWNVLFKTTSFFKKKKNRGLDMMKGKWCC